MVADTALGYGLWQGLNRGYDSFHQRNRDREDDARVAFEDEQARIRAERESEAHAYGLTRRANQERQDEQQVRANDQAYKAGQIGIEQSQGTLDEWKKNTNLREETNLTNLNVLKQQLKNAGITYDSAKIELEAKQSAKKYHEWNNYWNSGGTVEGLIKRFNSDKDSDGNPIKDNDILSVTGDEIKGWQVTFDNGQVIPFKNRGEVSSHIQSMGDQNFNQQLLLQREAQEAALAAAIAKSASTQSTLDSTARKNYEKQTDTNTQRYFTESIKEGLVSFGSEGSRDMAGDVRSVVDKIGLQGGHANMINSDVSRVAVQLAKTWLVKEPSERKRRAEEYLDKRRKEGVDIPKKGDDGYQKRLDLQMEGDYMQDYEIYQKKVFNHFLQLGKDGEPIIRGYSHLVTEPEQTDDPNAGNTITTEGLQRSSAESGASTTNAPGLPVKDTADVAASEDAYGIPDREEIPDDSIASQQVAALTGRNKERYEAREAKKLDEKQGNDYKKEVALKLGFKPSRRLTANTKKKLRNYYKKSFKSLPLNEKKWWMRHFSKSLYHDIRDEAYDMIKAEES